MGQLGLQMWTWTLCVLLSWMCVGQAVAGPHYMVAIPAVLEAGADTRFCASLVQPNETLTMIVNLISQRENRTLLEKTSNTEFHECVHFKAPVVENDEVQKMEVEVQGDTFHSKEVRKVLIKVYQPMTFVQTDKPIYLPGQTVHFRVVTLDTKLRPATGQYNIIELEDAHDNRIGQWLNQTSDGKILQLSYSLNSEAREGNYKVIVSIGDRKIYHNFKVEKYVLPKFDVKINTPDEVNIDQEEIEAEICAKYTYGQPVPGSVKVELCRPLGRYFASSIIVTPDHPEGIPEIVSPCHTETKQTDKTGCATFTFKMCTFTKLDKKALQDTLNLKASVEEEGTGTTHSQGKRMSISYVVGKVSFIDMPKIYEEGSNVEGKVKAVFYNDTPIPDMPVYVFEGQAWNARRIENLTTNSDGIATFSFNMANRHNDIKLHVSIKPTLEYYGYRTPYYENGEHTLSEALPPSQDTKTVSSLEVKKMDTPFPCDQEEEITIHYTVVGEAQGSVEVMYLVLSRGVILMQGLREIEVQDKSVNEGEVSFKLNVSPDMAPMVQVVVYAALPSETVIAHSADFAVEKCFGHKVSLEFSPSSAVPGEETILQMTAHPDSLCGVSAVDQSVLIKEPGKTLTTEKIFDLLPVTKLSSIPYEVQDPVECMHVRPRRYVLPHPDDDRDDAHKVFQNVGLKMATNLFIRVPTCLKYRGREYHHGVRMYNRYVTMSRMHFQGKTGSPPPVGAASNLAPIETVRTFFPETWIWNLVEVGGGYASPRQSDVAPKPRSAPKTKQLSTPTHPRADARMGEDLKCTQITQKMFPYRSCGVI